VFDFSEFSILTIKMGQLATLSKSITCEFDPL